MSFGNATSIFFLAVLFGFSAQAQVICTDQSSASSANGIVKFLDQATQVIQADKNCDDYFEKNPDARAFRKPQNFSGYAYDHMVGQQLGCLKGYSKGVAEQFNGLAAFVSKTWDTAKKQKEFVNDCEADETLTCKRRMAEEVGWPNLSDEKLRHISAAALSQRQQSVSLSMVQRQNDVDRALLAKDPSALSVSETDRIKEIKKQAEQARLESLKNLDALSMAAEKVLHKAGITLECYSAEKQNELLCYGISYIIDPTIIGGAGFKAMRIAAGVREAIVAEKAVEAIGARATASAGEVTAPIRRPVHAIEDESTMGDIVDLPPELRAQRPAQPPTPPTPPKGAAAGGVKSEKIWAEFPSGHNPFLNPMNQDQKKFLESLGFRFEGNQVIAPDEKVVADNYNKLIEEKIAKGEVSRKSALKWGMTYVDKDGKLVFKEAGQPAPPGTVPYEENKFILQKERDKDGNGIYKPVPPGYVGEASDPVLENPDFLRAIKEGLMPGSFSKFMVRYQTEYAMQSPLVIHELGHMGGFAAQPKGMAAFRDAVTKVQERYHGSPPKKIDDKIFYANEAAVTIKPESIEKLKDIVLGDSPKEIFRSFADRANGVTSRLSADQLQDRVAQVMNWHMQSRDPFGGALRTPQLAVDVKTRIDLLYHDLSSKSAILKLAMSREYSAPTGRLSAALLNKDRNVESARQALQKSLKEYVGAADDLSQTSIQGWFGVATHEEPLQRGSPYYRYMCEGEVRDIHRDVFCE